MNKGRVDYFNDERIGRISRDDCSHRGLKWSAVAIGLDVEPDPHFEPAEGKIVSISVFFKTKKKNNKVTTR